MTVNYTPAFSTDQIHDLSYHSNFTAFYLLHFIFWCRQSHFGFLPLTASPGWVPTATVHLVTANVFNPSKFASASCQQHKIRNIMLYHPKVAFSNSLIFNAQLRNTKRKTKLIPCVFILIPNTDWNQLLKIPHIFKQIFKKCSYK